MNVYTYYYHFFVTGKRLHGLVHAATEYQKVFEENRKLYNQVQDLKGIIIGLMFDLMSPLPCKC